MTANRIDKLKSNLDQPRTLEELHIKPGKPGYDEHHIVEKKSAARDGFSQTKIQDRENIVYIPRMKHREITTWYQTRNSYYSNLTPRRYLRGKSWEVRREVGIQKLRDFGVLK